MKAYTDIEQSKKLAEILPIESADMAYIWHATSDSPTFRFDEDMPPMILQDIPINEITADTLPCWSFVALFKLLPIFTEPTAFSVKVCVPLLSKTNNGYSLTYGGDYVLRHNNSVDIAAPIEIVADNPIDACVEMVIKLHELNLL